MNNKNNEKVVLLLFVLFCFDVVYVCVCVNVLIYVVDIVLL